MQSLLYVSMIADFDGFRKTVVVGSRFRDYALGFGACRFGIAWELA